MIQFDDETLTQVTRDVCETMLGVPLSEETSREADEPRLVASVRITGGATMTVEVETVREAARPFAGQMFSADLDQLGEPDLRDALGEIANMIGGNVKGILCGEFDLSIPTIQERNTTSVIPSTIVASADFSVGGFPFLVRLLAT